MHQGARSLGAHSGTTGATSAHVTCENIARGTFPAARKAISVKEREGGRDTDLSFLLTPFPTGQTRGGPGAGNTGPSTPPAPAGEQGNVTPSPARRAVRGTPTPERFSPENLISQGGGPGTNVPPARMTSEKIIHQGTGSQNTDDSAQEVPASGHTTCVHVISKGGRLRNECDTNTEAHGFRKRSTPGHRITEHLLQ